MSREGHRVPAGTIRGWMGRWKPDLTVEDILRYDPPSIDRATSTATFYAGLRHSGCGLSANTAYFGPAAYLFKESVP
jgi:hypothetical protein